MLSLAVFPRISRLLQGASADNLLFPRQKNDWLKLANSLSLIGHIGNETRQLLINCLHIQGPVFSSPGFYSPRTNQ